MIESIMKYLCVMIVLFLTAVVVVVCWVGPLFMMFLFSPWWLLSYGITLLIFFGIYDWVEGDGF